MKTKSHIVKATYPNLETAARESGLDFSDHTAEMSRQITMLDGGFGGRDAGTALVLQLEDDRMFVLYQADLLLLNELNLYGACLHDGPYYPVIYNPEKKTISVGPSLGRNRSAIIGIHLAACKVAKRLDQRIWFTKETI